MAATIIPEQLRLNQMAQLQDCSCFPHLLYELTWHTEMLATVPCRCLSPGPLFQGFSVLLTDSEGLTHPDLGLQAQPSDSFPNVMLAQGRWQRLDLCLLVRLLPSLLPSPRGHCPWVTAVSSAPMPTCTARTDPTQSGARSRAARPTLGGTCVQPSKAKSVSHKLTGMRKWWAF